MSAAAVVGDEPLRTLVLARLGDRPDETVPIPEAPVVVVCREGLPGDVRPDAHIIHVSRVGAGLVERRPYSAAAAVERAVEARRHTVLRATEFHSDVWALLDRWAGRPLMLVPNDVRFQPLDATTVADLVADLAERPPAGRLDDVGGRFAYESRELARSYLAAVGRRRPVIALNSPGLAGAAMRAGANLTPNRTDAGRSWNDFVASKL